MSCRMPQASGETAIDEAGRGQVSGTEGSRVSSCAGDHHITCAIYRDGDGRIRYHPCGIGLKPGNGYKSCGPGLGDRLGEERGIFQHFDLNTC